MLYAFLRQCWERGSTETNDGNIWQSICIDSDLLPLDQSCVGRLRQIDLDISLVKFECSLDWSLFIN